MNRALCDPNLGDKWVKAKANRSQRWYLCETARELIQCCGRSVRSVDDHAITYVLDTCFGDFINRNKVLFPKWFVDSVIWPK